MNITTTEGKTMNSIELKGKTYTIKGELPNGVFYLEGPKGGDVHFAKPAADVYMFFRATGGAAIYENGLIVTATREQLAA
jgi:hypothetical protein